MIKKCNLTIYYIRLKKKSTYVDDIYMIYIRMDDNLTTVHVGVILYRA